jgi:dipeptidase
LRYLALQRSRTAREAIECMTRLVAEYGYASDGESFSISDPNEVWILEMISKGPANKGAVWVARKIPEGYICGHANQPRIRQFPLNERETCLYAPDVISFAREKGYFQGKDEVLSTDIRGFILTLLDSIAPTVSMAWRNHDNAQGK